MAYTLPKITAPTLGTTVKKPTVNWSSPQKIPTTINTGATMGDITGRLDAINRATSEPAVPSRAQVGEMVERPHVARAIDRETGRNPDEPETAYDRKRQSVDAWRADQMRRREEAIRAQLATQGLGGGIERGEMRTMRGQVGQEAAARMAGIDVAELAGTEAEKAREWATGERESGQDWQSSENALGRDMAMKLEEGRASQFYASLKQQGSIAESAQELQKYGIDQSTAYNYASLDQARYFTEQGFDLQRTAQALQERGLDQQNAQYYAGLAQTEQMFGKAIYADVFKAMLVPFMEKIDVNSPEYQQFIKDMGAAFGIEGLSLPADEFTEETRAANPLLRLLGM